MARNRKSQSVAVRFGPPLKAFLLCLLIGGSGVGYVWQKDQIARLGQQRRSREVRLESLKTQNERLKRQLVQLCSTEMIKKSVEDFKLPLALPEPGMKVRLVEPACEPVSAEHKTEFAARMDRDSGPR
jgi:hypothetical protein